MLQLQEAAFRLKRMNQREVMGFSDVANGIERIARTFANQNPTDLGLLAVSVEDADNKHLVICEAEVFEGILRILDELYLMVENGLGLHLDPLGILERHLDSYPTSPEKRERLIDGFGSFYARAVHNV